MTLQEIETAMLKAVEAWCAQGGDTDANRARVAEALPAFRSALALPSGPFALRRETRVGTANFAGHDGIAAIVDAKGNDVLHLHWGSSRNESEGCAERVLALLNREAEAVPVAWAEMRQAFLDDPDHDSDTINWALGIIDDHALPAATRGV